MKTRDEVIRDLAERAQDQCEALFDKMYAVIDGVDDEGDLEDERLCGIGRDGDGRFQMVFAAIGAPRGRRTIVYVDAILALAKLLNGEVQVND